jgi:hypothetical protein
MLMGPSLQVYIYVGDPGANKAAAAGRLSRYLEGKTPGPPAPKALSAVIASLSFPLFTFAAGDGAVTTGQNGVSTGITLNQPESTRRRNNGTDHD